MSFHCTSNIKYNFGFYVAHGWSISNLCSVVSNTYPSLQPNSFPADLQAPHYSTPAHLSFFSTTSRSNHIIHWLKFRKKCPV